MSKFRELYNADIARYGGRPGAYMRVFHFLYRKAATTSFVPNKILWLTCKVPCLSYPKIL